MKTIDLRSDTVTHPTERMRKAMYEAEVGDDVYGEDPTVNRLQTKAAQLLEKEAALFVASGSMGNLVSLLAHCGRGTQVILGAHSHIYHYEQGGMASLAGLHARPVPNNADGTLSVREIEGCIEPEDLHFARTALICLENTWNGVPLETAYTAEVAALARRHGLKMHLDGARLFNAAVALGCPPAKLTNDFDSVTFCLSKGLAAPVGSVVCGSAEFIHEVTRHRKLVGGAMRQAGILAAAGIVALEQMIARLAEDHRHAQQLATALANIPALAIDMTTVKTNMVFFSFKDEAVDLEFACQRLAKEGVLVMTAGRQIRAVTHHGITSADVKAVIEGFHRVFGPTTFTVSQTARIGS